MGCLYLKRQLNLTYIVQIAPNNKEYDRLQPEPETCWWSCPVTHQLNLGNQFVDRRIEIDTRCQKNHELLHGLWAQLRDGELYCLWCGQGSDRHYINIILTGDINNGVHVFCSQPQFETVFETLVFITHCYKHVSNPCLKQHQQNLLFLLCTATVWECYSRNILSI